MNKEELAKAKKDNMQKCSEEIQTILNEYGCNLVAIPQIKDGIIVAVITIQAE